MAAAAAETASSNSIFRALLEIGPDGSTLAAIAELPGCFARAPTKDEALSKLQNALAAHLAWLRQCGEPGPRRRQAVAIEVAEELVVTCDVKEGYSAAFFAADLAPTTPELAARFVRLLGYSRAALLQSVAGLSAAALDRTDPKRRRARPKGEAPAPASIRAVLAHVARTEPWYASRLERDEAAARRACDAAMALAARARDTLDLLDRTREGALARLARLTDEERVRVTIHRDEPWSAHKVLRRLLFHERLHARSIAKMRSRLVTASDSGGCPAKGPE